MKTINGILRVTTPARKLGFSNGMVIEYTELPNAIKTSNVLEEVYGLVDSFTILQSNGEYLEMMVGGYRYLVDIENKLFSELEASYGFMTYKVEEVAVVEGRKSICKIGNNIYGGYVVGDIVYKLLEVDNLLLPYATLMGADEKLYLHNHGVCNSEGETKITADEVATLHVGFDGKEVRLVLNRIGYVNLHISQEDLIILLKVAYGKPLKEVFEILKRLWVKP